MLFVVVMYFLVMSNVVGVWWKGVRWQVWGPSCRHWHAVLTYLGASWNLYSNFNCDKVNLCMMIDVQTFPDWYTGSRKLMQTGLTIQTNLVTGDNDNEPGSCCYNPPFGANPVTSCKTLQDFAPLTLQIAFWCASCLAKWSHPSNRWQPISILQQLAAVPTLARPRNSDTPDIFLTFFCFWSVTHFLCAFPSGPLLATIDN